MSSRHLQFTNLYDDQVADFRQVRSPGRIPDRVSEPAVIITVFVLLVAIIFKFLDLELSWDVIVYTVFAYVWDFIVLITPTPLLVAVHNWLNPDSMSETRPGTHAAKSQVLRKVLGLDRTAGVMESVLHVRSRALSVTGNVLGLKLDPERPAGLGNRDNSCYQNSILQGLASLRSFPRYLSAFVQCIDRQQETNDVAHTLRTLIADLNDVSNNGRTIWTPSLLKSMSTWTQQDAQEYFSKILDDVDRSVAEAVRSMGERPGFETDSRKDHVTASEHGGDGGYHGVSSSVEIMAQKWLRNPLEGLLAQRVACIQCGYSEGLSMIPFNCLTLSLGLDKHQHDLYERLDAYSKVEAIEGVECPKCTLLKAQRLLTKLVESLKDIGSPADQIEEPMRRLEAVALALEEDHFDEKTMTEECKISSQGKVNTTKTKQIVIARPPRSLAIHINRSVFDPRTFDMIKNSAPVSFPQTLDLGPWCLGSAEDMEGKFAGKAGSGQEQWMLDPKSSMIAGDLDPSRLSGPIYELRAAVTHYGRHENGHYICYRKYPETDDSTDGQETCAPAAGEGIDGSWRGQTQKDETKPPRSRRNGGWWRLSDHNVSEVEEDVIMSLGPGVFMLFYECVDPSIILQNEADYMEEARQDSLEAEAPSAKKRNRHDLFALSSATNETNETWHEYLSSSASDISEPETLITTSDTIGAPTTVTSAPSSVSNWTHDADDMAKSEGEVDGFQV